MTREPARHTDAKDVWLSDLAEHFWPALRGELAGPVAHEFNNFLNNILLEIAFLEQRAPEPLRPRLAVIRKHARRIADTVKEFQEFCQRTEPPPAQIDLNAFIQENARAWRSSSVDGPLKVREVIFELSPELPAISAPPGDLRRLLWLLLTQAAAAPPNGGIVVRTEKLENGVRLCVSHGHKAGESTPKNSSDNESAINLKMAACQSIVYRLGGRLRAADPPAFDTTVELPLTVSLDSALR